MDGQMRDIKDLCKLLILSYLNLNYKFFFATIKMNNDQLFC